MASRIEPSFAGVVSARLKERSIADRRILLVGLLNERLPDRQRAVLVGGALVEFLTVGAYVSGDLDLVGDRAKIGKLLQSAGFVPDGRHFSSEALGLLVEVPSSSLRKTETVVEFEFEGMRIPSVSIEDAIVDRLLAAERWKSPTDWEQAILLYATLRDRIDERELDRKSAQNVVRTTLDLLRRTVGDDKK